MRRGCRDARTRAAASRPSGSQPAQPRAAHGPAGAGRQVRRIEGRLSRLGVAVVRRYDEEFSVIPMGGPLPVLGQPTVCPAPAAAPLFTVKSSQ